MPLHTSFTSSGFRIITVLFLIVSPYLPLPELVPQEQHQTGKASKETPVNVTDCQTIRKNGSTYVVLECKFLRNVEADVQFYLRNALEPVLLDQTQKPPSRNKMRVWFGPFPDLWASTYEILVRHPEPIGAESERNPSSRPSTFQFSLPSSEKVPEPKQQKNQFHQTHKSLLLKLRSLFLSVRSGVKTGKERRRSGEATGDFARRLREETKSTFRTLRKNLKQLRNTHKFGSPYRDRIRALSDLAQLFRRYQNKSIPSIHSDWTPEHPGRYRSFTRGERIRNKIASPRDLRFALLNRLFHHLPQPFPAEYRITEWFLQFAKLLHQKPEKSTGDPSGHHQCIAANRRQKLKQITTCRESIYRLRILYRDPPARRGRVEKTRKKILSRLHQFHQLQNLLKDAGDEPGDEFSKHLVKIAETFNRAGTEVLISSVSLLHDHLKNVLSGSAPLLEGQSLSDSERQRRMKKLLSFLTKQQKALHQKPLTPLRNPVFVIRKTCGQLRNELRKHTSLHPHEDPTNIFKRLEQLQELLTKTGQLRDRHRRCMEGMLGLLHGDPQSTENIRTTYRNCRILRLKLQNFFRDTRKIKKNGKNLREQLTDDQSSPPTEKKQD